MGRDWLRLIRASGLCTVVANAAAVVSVAGPLDQGRLLSQWWRNSGDAAWILLCGLLCYATGMVWNDLVDAERDRQIAPHRPLPSGRLGQGPATIVALVLPGVALLVAAQVGTHALLAAGVVLTFIMLYNLGTKTVPWLGAANLALVRLSHAVLALLILGRDEFERAVAGLLFIGTGTGGLGGLGLYLTALACYVFGLSLAAELEHRRARRWELILAGLLILAAPLLLAAWLPVGDLWRRWSSGAQYLPLAIMTLLTLVPAGYLLTRLGRAWYDAVVGAKRRQLPPLIVGALMGFVLLDVVAIAPRQPLLAVLVLGLLPLQALLARLARMD